MIILSLKTNIKNGDAKNILNQISKTYSGLYYRHDPEGDEIILTIPQVENLEQIQQDIDAILKSVNKDHALVKMQEVAFVPQGAISLCGVLQQEFKALNFIQNSPTADLAVVCQMRFNAIDQRYTRIILQNNEKLKQRPLFPSHDPWSMPDLRAELTNWDHEKLFKEFKVKNQNEELTWQRNVELEKTLVAFFEVEKLQACKSGKEKQGAFFDHFIKSMSKPQVEMKESPEKTEVKIFFTRRQPVFANQDGQRDEIFKDAELLSRCFHEKMAMFENFAFKIDHTQNGFCLSLSMTVTERSREFFQDGWQCSLILLGLENLYSVSKITYPVLAVANTAANHPSSLGKNLPKQSGKDPELTKNSVDEEKLLSKYRISTETSNPEANVAFRRAAAVGNIEDVRIFINHFKVDINSKSLNGKTARDWASERGHTEIVKLIDEMCELKSHVQNSQNQSSPAILAVQAESTGTKLSTNCKKIILDFKRSHGRTHGNISTSDAIKALALKIQELPLCKQYNIRLEAVLEKESNTDFTINLLGISIADDDKASQKNLKHMLLNILYAVKVGELYIQDEFIMKKIRFDQKGEGQVITVSPPEKMSKHKIQPTQEGAGQVATLNHC